MGRFNESLFQAIVASSLLMLSVLFFTPFAISSEFFGGLLGAKFLLIEQISLLLVFTIPLLLLFSQRFSINKIDLSVFLFWLWCAASEVFIHNSDMSLFIRHLYHYLLWGFLYIAFRLVSANAVSVTTLVVVWITATLVMAVMGLLQLYNLVPSNHNLFPTTGPFHNPGPFSGWISAGVPVTFAILLASWFRAGEKASRKEVQVAGIKLQIVTSLSWYMHRLFFVLTSVTMFVVLLVLPPAGSRAAWIASATGLLYVVWRYPGRLKIRDDFLLWLGKISRLQILLLASLLTVIIVAGAIGLYNLKRGSADGRVLIWRVTAGLVSERPLTGYGAEAFQRHYMSRQADWFDLGKGSPAQFMSAGSPQYPFNETLNIWLKKGLLSIMLLSVILWFLLTARWTYKTELNEERFSSDITSRELNSEWQNTVILTGLKGSLLVILIFAQFSYPFDISSFVLQLVAITAIIAGRTKPILVIDGRKRFLVILPMIIAIIATVWITIPQRREYYSALTRWREAHNLYTARAYEHSAGLYGHLYEPLRHMGLFLQMYGKTLSMADRYEESNVLLIEAEGYMSSQIINLTVGDNFRALGKTEDAGEAYKKAALMVPNMLYPRYQLAQMFAEAGMLREADSVARSILGSTVKVESEATRDIMKQMKEIIAEYEERN